MTPEYIIVQAGGKGTRLGKLTKNKPKALVPVDNLPMLFHLFKKYPVSNFIIIGDYKIDVLKRYLCAFAKVNYKVVNASGHTGTCAGISEALKEIPTQTPFMLIWSDLVLPLDFEIPEAHSNMVGLSQGFQCRWRYSEAGFEEIPSNNSGVAGLFVFQDKKMIETIPLDGEFVRWLKTEKLEFQKLLLSQTNEYGLIEVYNNLELKKCRPFNQIEISGDKVVKRPLDENGKMLAEREKKWYNAARAANFSAIPQIYNEKPLILERIYGRNVYECTELSLGQKSDVLKKIVLCLKKLHLICEQPVDRRSVYETYVDKTFDRLEKIRNLVPFATEKKVIINGKPCRNIFFHREEIKQRIEECMPESFCFIHGDCTFSNIILKNDSVPIFIDPRGYFGHTDLYGDEDYDWAKLYYSLRGDYDQFNLKRFSLEIRSTDIIMNIESNGWNELEDDFFSLIGGTSKENKIKLLHALIWLSLTTYAWENYDSICGAFYNGLWYLEEVL